MQKKTTLYIVLIISLLTMISCSFFPANNNAGKPTPTSTVVTKESTKPAHQPPEAEQKKQVCNVNDIIVHLESITPYEFAEVFFTGFNDPTSYALNVWIVDPEITAQASDPEIGANVYLAKQHAAETIQEYIAAEPCIYSLFPSGIIIQMVDNQFNSWYQGILILPDLSENENNTELFFDHLYDLYTRSIPIDTSKQLNDPLNTLDKMHSEFQEQFGSNPNSFVYISIDEQYGLMVSLQFEMNPEVVKFAEDSHEKMMENITLFGNTGTANAVFVTAYMDPQPDILFTSSVEQNGNMIYLSTIEQNEDQQIVLDTINVLFPTQTANNHSQLVGLYCSVTMVVDAITQNAFTDCTDIQSYFIQMTGDNFNLEQFNDTEWVVELINQYFEINQYPLRAEVLPTLSNQEIKQKSQEGIYNEIAVVQSADFYHALLIIGLDDNSELQLADFMSSNYQDISSPDKFYEDYGINFEEAWVNTIEITFIEP